MGYDKGVEESFFNIWRKHREIDYRFMGVEFKKLMMTWTDREKMGTLNTKPPPSPQYSNAKEDDDVMELEPSNGASEQVPLAYTREEDTVSNPSPTEDEPAFNTLDGAPPANVGEEELVANTTDKASLA